jgi:hypothetical protein
MMAKKHSIKLACVGFALFSFACEFDEPCQANDPKLVEKFGIPEHQTQGKDGLCYVVDPEVKNWGGACDSLDLCGGGLICAAPNLPLCTAIDCDPDNTKDKVCGDGFMCIESGKDSPTVCVPMVAPPAASTSQQSSSEAATSTAGDAGASDAGSGSADDTGESPSTTASETSEVAPNIGTECDMADDPICVGGAFCEPAQLGICTVGNCTEGGEYAAACAAVGFCYSTAPAPETGICTVQ